MMIRRALALILVMSAGVLRAQGDAPAPRIRPDGGTLAPLVLTYVATVQLGTDIRPIGERSVSLTKSSYAGLSAWEIVETRGAGANAAVDTLVVDYLTLTPFHWGASQPVVGVTGGAVPAAARISAEFRSDTMMAAMSSPTGRRNLIAALQPGAFVTAAHFEMALRALPIAAANFRDSTWLVVSVVGRSASIPAAIQVTGEEKLLTPAGTFDCWIVSLTTDVGSTQYWVSKADRVVVQSTQLVPETGATLKYQLSKISH